MYKKFKIKLKQKIISNKLEKNFNLIQLTLFKKRPVLGAQNWILLNYKIYDNNQIKVYMEDGHIEHSALIEYREDKDMFVLVKEL